MNTICVYTTTSIPGSKVFCSECGRFSGSPLDDAFPFIMNSGTRMSIYFMRNTAAGTAPVFHWIPFSSFTLDELMTPYSNANVI